MKLNAILCLSYFNCIYFREASNFPIATQYLDDIEYLESKKYWMATQKKNILQAGKSFIVTISIWPTFIHILNERLYADKLPNLGNYDIAHKIIISSSK